MRRRFAHVVAGLIGGGLLLLGMAGVGKLTKDEMRERERHSLPFSAIECTPPPGLERTDFLDQVQYLSDRPDRISLLDEHLAADLADAFAQHPWVEKVERVEVTRPGQVKVRLVYRTPVLAVPLGEEVRAVDGSGIVLPPGAPTQDLPVFRGKAAKPIGPSGSVWGDPTIELAARLAAFLVPHRARLHVAALHAQSDTTFVLATSAGARVRWGHAPGAETDTEPSASRKLERLLHHCDAHGDLDHPAGKELDLRRTE